METTKKETKIKYWVTMTHDRHACLDRRCIEIVQTCDTQVMIFSLPALTFSLDITGAVDKNHQIQGSPVPTFSHLLQVYSPRVMLIDAIVF